MTRGWLISIAMGAAVAAPGAQATEFYKLGSLAPGMSAFTVNTTFAHIVNKYVPDTKVQISATGSGMRHQLLAAQGKLDFFMATPIGHLLMVRQIGPFKKLKNGAALVKNLRHIFSYELGPYHFVTYANSGIMRVADLKGKKVFIGPPGGSATRSVAMMILGQTGFKAGKDYQTVRMSWSAAQQAFQDKKYDVMVMPTNWPSPSIQQIAITNKIRLLSLTYAKQNRALKTPGRSRAVIPVGVYGKNMVNTKPVTTLGYIAGLGVRKGVSADAVYAMTKAFWTHLKEVHAAAPWMKNTVTLDRALQTMPHPLHPGAARYYREIGLKIPPVFKPKARKKK